MTEKAADTRLFELADAILAVSRHLQAAKPAEHPGGTPLHTAVLRQVDRRPGITINEVAEATRILPSNVSRAVRGLETAGYVRRVIDEVDGRRVQLHPTRQAEENLRELRAAWARLLAPAVPAGAQIDQVVALLQGIEHRL